MFAFGLCVDERYLVPALVTIESLAATLTPAQRREAAVRVLTLDMTRQHARTMADLAARVGFGSFDLAWAEPMREALLPDSAYITITAYLRFGFTAGFVGRPHLIYIDADTLPIDDVTGPLHDLGGRLGLVGDEFNPAVGRGHALPGLTADRPELAGRPYYNGGVWWAPVGLLPTIRAGVARVLTTQGRYIYHNDQDALNLWALDTGQVRTVPGRYNTYELGRFLERGDWVRRYTTRSPHPTRAALLHFVGSAKPWLPSCPPTEHTRLWRAYLRTCLRTVGRLGDLSIDQPRWSRWPR